MVVIHLKKGEESQFLLEVPASTSVADLHALTVSLYNSRLVIFRLCSELESLAEYGVALPTNMVGLTPDQVQELNLEDQWSKQHGPSGGYVECKDPCGKRNGQQPVQKMQQVLTKTIAEVKGMISKDRVQNNKPLEKQEIDDAFSMLEGAVTIVYPMGLPDYDSIQIILKDRTCTSLPEVFADIYREIIEPNMAQLWFAGKKLEAEKLLQYYIGKNEKTKVIVKLSKRDHGPPCREPQMDAATEASMMSFWHKRQQELKRLEEDSDDCYLDSTWADSGELQRNFHGLDNIKWRP